MASSTHSLRLCAPHRSRQMRGSRQTHCSCWLAGCSACTEARARAGVRIDSAMCSVQAAHVASGLQQCSGCIGSSKQPNRSLFWETCDSYHLRLLLKAHHAVQQSATDTTPSLWSSVSPSALAFGTITHCLLLDDAVGGGMSAGLVADGGSDAGGSVPPLLPPSTLPSEVGRWAAAHRAPTSR